MPCVYHEETNFSYGKPVRSLVLENDELSMRVDPWDGGRITRLYDKLRGCDLVWTNPRTQHLTRYYAANYDDLSNSGVEEAFPTVGPCQFAEAQLPFFGEVWAVPWEYQVLTASGGEIVLRLTCLCSIYTAKITKTISIRQGSSDVKMDYEIENLGPEPFDYVFGVHPSICISAQTEIEMPDGEYQINYLHPQDLEPVQSFRWHQFGRLDLSKVDILGDGVCINFLTGTVGSGRYGFYDREKNSGIWVRFDPQFFKCLSIWLIHGGWRGHYCAMTEFFTSWPASVKEAYEAGLAVHLPERQSQRTSVVYSIFTR